MELAEYTQHDYCETLSNAETTETSMAPHILRSRKRVTYVDTLVQLPIVYLSLEIPYFLQDLLFLTTPILRFRGSFPLQASLLLS